MLSANKYAIVVKELDRCKRDDLYLIGWIYPDFDPLEVKNHPDSFYQPTIEDAINEIANYYGNSFEEYQAISDELNELVKA